MNSNASRVGREGEGERKGGGRVGEREVSGKRSGKVGGKLEK